MLMLAVLPYFLAERMGGTQFVFGGFLLNPLDGNSYLAKMFEGWQGAWTFTLPFTATPGEGTYLFVFYLLLGHIARWTGLSLLLVFHLARVLSALVFLVALNRFFQWVLPEHKLTVLAFTLAALGGGLGWLAYPWLGLFTPDMWVAEAFPFLSVYSNPHFPLALALLMAILQSYSRRFSSGQWAKSISAGFSIGMLLPFGVVIAGLLLIARAIWEW
ncbi:MAG: hypothetical protein PHQ40_13455, partial [Anaerolineaceae bacterium]|nr:hypothetical protein [Anaerolineaceae bacterium]